MTHYSLQYDDTRALLIFGTYLSICTSLTGLIVRDLFKQYKSVQHRSWGTNTIYRSTNTTQVFAACAAVSLSITWYYMISFFSVSYQAWAFPRGTPVLSAPAESSGLILWMHGIHLGQWLKDVQLFREAWEIAMETPGRLAWSQPIFFITTAWGFFITHEGTKSIMFLQDM